MKRFFKICALPLFTLSFIHPAFSDVSGTYECTGYDPFLKEDYTSTMTITKTGDTYRFEWKETNDSYSGTGILEGDSIASVFTNYGLPKRYGVAVYSGLDKEILHGQWSYVFQNVIGTEDCKRVKGKEIESKSTSKVNAPNVTPGP